MDRHWQKGFSFVELVITVGVILVATTWAMPSFLRYLRTAEAQADAREVTAILNRARQDAIKENCSITATRGTGGFTMTKGATCSVGAGGSLILPGMTSAGLFKTSQNITLTGIASAVFSNLGNATTSGTFTLTSTKYGTTMRVIVDPSGRIWIQQ
jgi:prepilin-type N-terminal cleavage/methylation domain-containing protein